MDYNIVGDRTHTESSMVLYIYVIIIILSETCLEWYVQYMYVMYMYIYESGCSSTHTHIQWLDKRRVSCNAVTVHITYISTYVLGIFLKMLQVSNEFLERSFVSPGLAQTKPCWKVVFASQGCG